MPVKILCLIFAAGLASLAGNALAGGDPTRGEAVFRQCRSCHSVEDGANRLGPSLFHVVGRPAAAIEDFRYSDAMRAFGAAGHTWDEATLSSYLAAPQDYIPDVAMRFAGLKRPQDIADVIAYLRDPAAAKSGW